MTEFQLLQFAKVFTGQQYEGARQAYAQGLTVTGIEFCHYVPSLVTFWFSNRRCVSSGPSAHQDTFVKRFFSTV